MNGNCCCSFMLAFSLIILYFLLAFRSFFFFLVLCIAIIKRHRKLTSCQFRAAPQSAHATQQRQQQRLRKRGLKWRGGEARWQLRWQRIVNEGKRGRGERQSNFNLLERCDICPAKQTVDLQLQLWLHYPLFPLSSFPSSPPSSLLLHLDCREDCLLFCFSTQMSVQPIGICWAKAKMFPLCRWHFFLPLPLSLTRLTFVRDKGQKLHAKRHCCSSSQSLPQSTSTLASTLTSTSTCSANPTT